MNRSSVKRSHHHLKELIEALVRDEFNLQSRGLSFVVDEQTASGKPPRHIKVWATLHYLPAGSPFCCTQPDCQLSLFGERLDILSDGLRHMMGIRQSLSLEFVLGSKASYPGVEFKTQFAQRR
jgi:hypothetical protein